MTTRDPAGAEPSGAARAAMSGLAGPGNVFAAGHSPPRRLLRARRRLRADLAQVLCVLLGLALGLALPLVQGGPTVEGSRLVGPLFTMGIGVISVVSIVYSLLFGVVQWSASSYSPRLNLFRSDPLVWRTFAVAIGVFVFCVTAALACVDPGRVSMLVPSMAVLGVLTAVALIRMLQIRAFQSLQLAYVLETIAAAGRAVIDDVYPVLYTPEPGASGAAASLPARRRSVIWIGPPGLIQQLELRRLVDEAGRADAVVAFRVGVGDSLHEGTALADLHGGDLPDPVVRAAVVRSRERSFDQDPMLAFRLLADVGLRALSPAVNDPATAVDAIDATEGLLRALAGRDLGVTDIPDSAGSTRVRLVLPLWEDYLGTGVTDLLKPAAPSAMVLERLQLLIANLLEASPLPAHAALVTLSEQVQARLAATQWTGAQDPRPG
jgi:uncharacterized membrane protein